MMARSLGAAARERSKNEETTVMPVAVKDMVAHVASMDTPVTSNEVMIDSIADAIGSINTKADRDALQRDLVANKIPLSRAIAHDPRVAGSAAPVGVAAPASTPRPGGPRRLAPGQRPDDMPPLTGAYSTGQVSDVPAAFSEIRQELSAISEQLDALAGTVSRTMPRGPDDLGAAPPPDHPPPPETGETPPAAAQPPNGPVA